MRRRDFISLSLLCGLAAAFGDIAIAVAQDVQQTGSKDLTDQASSDLALVLASEFGVWFRKLGAQGALPRAFAGVKGDGKQAVVILTGLPLDNIQRREFLIWLCRTEQFIAYAYATHVGVAANDSASTITEGIDIYASSNRYDASKTLVIDRLTDGTFRFSEEHNAVLPASPENGLFFGLQRSTDGISSDNQELFSNLWRDAKQKAMWRQR